MPLKSLLADLSAVALMGGLAVMKYLFARKASQARNISLGSALANTDWLRDDSGRFRWVIPAWIVFWVAVLILSSGG